MEVKLTNARLFGCSGRSGEIIEVCDRNCTRRWGYFRFDWNESLADKEDVRKFNSLLADLSGRRVEDFEEAGITMDPLVKSGGKDA
jgi:hypothetical protein